MQWTADRNAGFSEADSAALYSPVITDPVFGFQSINVEAQDRTSTSLLAWMRRIIRLRKKYKAFGRGSFEALPLANRKVLAYLREYESEVILVVANLSRFAQAAELDLSRFAGSQLIELFCETPFPPIGELPYLLTFAPHGFYLFRIVKS
jgi:maltose alpha-D-glucosyltransferase/alpha-amylase